MAHEDDEGLFRRSRWRSEPPTADELLADLVDLHGERPGVTEATLGALRTTDGRTGYDVLAAAVPPDATAVLELGCGNGPLLEVLAARTPPLSWIVGVDACEPDLALARARLAGDPRVELIASRAQQLALPDGAFDAVLSHHALYLFDPLEPVLDHVRRLLRPGGLLAFVTVASDRNAVYAAAMDVFGALNKRDNPHFRGWGDPRIWTASGLHELFVASGRFATLHVEPFEVSIAEPPAALTARLMRFFYSVDLLRPASRGELERAWFRLFAAHAGPDGRTTFSFPSALVTAA